MGGLIDNKAPRGGLGTVPQRRWAPIHARERDTARLLSTDPESSRRDSSLRIEDATCGPGLRPFPAIRLNPDQASHWRCSAGPSAISTVEGPGCLGILFTQAGHHVMQVLSRQLTISAPFQAGVRWRLDPGHTRWLERSRAQEAGGEVHGDPPSGVDFHTRAGPARRSWARLSSGGICKNFAPI
jgi:hypothetical protein